MRRKRRAKVLGDLASKPTWKGKRIRKLNPNHHQLVDVRLWLFILKGSGRLRTKKMLRL